MNFLEETKSLLQSHRIEPKKTMGQNFLVDSRFYEKMAQYACLNRDDTVLEIGAGTGLLTRFLKKKCKQVLAVEFDRKLVNVLHEQMGNSSNVKIIQGDALKVNIPSFNKIVSIPPYQISSPLIVWLSSKCFDSAVLVFQKEFAHRLVAPAGTDDYGWLTVFTYYYAQVELLDILSKSFFYPQPKVDSVITCIRPKKLRPSAPVDFAALQRLLQTFFTHRNRTVKNAALTYLKNARKVTKEDALRIASALPFIDRRVREIAPGEIGAIVNAIPY